MKPLTILYHGTSMELAAKIKKTGFKKDSYFSKHLEDAIAFGGSIVFEVLFKDSELPNNWQVKVSTRVDKSRICVFGQYVHHRRVNEKLWKLLQDSNDPDILGNTQEPYNIKSDWKL